MRRLLALLLMLLLVPQVQAGFLDTAKQSLNMRVGAQDYSGVTVRGSVGLSTGQSASTTTLFRGQASFGGSCDNFDFADSLKEAFQNLPDIFATIGKDILLNLPMLAACEISPVLCDLWKHFQALINATLQMKYARCQQVKTAMAYAGSRLHGGEQAKCLDEATRQGGMSITQAMNACLTTTPFLGGLDGNRTQSITLIGDTLARVGASNETRQLASNLLGDVVLQANGGRLTTDHTRPILRMFQEYEARRQATDDALIQAVQEFQTTGQVSDQTRLSLSVPGQVLPQGAIEGLAALQRDQVRYEALRTQLTTAIALTQLTWDCMDLQAQIRVGIEDNPNATDEERRMIEQRLAVLTQDLTQLKAKISVVKEHLHPAYEALMREYAGVQEEAKRAGMAAPSVTLPRLPYGSQTPAGYRQ